MLRLRQQIVVYIAKKEWKLKMKKITSKKQKREKQSVKNKAKIGKTKK